MTVDRTFAVIALGLGLLAPLVGGKTLPAGDSGEIGALEVARTLRADPEGILIVDVRDRAAWDALHLPRAVHLPARRGDGVPALSPGEWRRRLEAQGLSEELRIVVVGGPDAPTAALWAELRSAGYVASQMPDMLADWLDTIVSPVRAPTDDPLEKARWDEQAELARYFGGFPRVTENAPRRSGTVAQRLRQARRRGCAI